MQIFLKKKAEFAFHFSLFAIRCSSRCGYIVAILLGCNACCVAEVAVERCRFGEGERVTVYNETKDADLEGYLEALEDGATAQLEGELTGTVDAGDKLTLKFCSPSYMSQNGTLEYISADIGSSKVRLWFDSERRFCVTNP